MSSSKFEFLIFRSLNKSLKHIFIFSFCPFVHPYNYLYVITIDVYCVIYLRLKTGYLARSQSGPSQFFIFRKDDDLIY